MSTVNAHGRPLPHSRPSANRVEGTSFSETLYGTAADDAVIARGGGDVLVGGAGDDVYTLGYGLDQVIERPGEGVDTINAFDSYALPADTENLILWDWSAHGYGNALDNLLMAYNGDQVLDGRGGADVLSGGGGPDVFVFSPGGGRDVVVDFTLGVDKARLKSGAFHDFAQVRAAMTQVGSDAVLALGPDQSVTFRNRRVEEFQSGDFQLPIDYGAMTLTFVDHFDAFDRRVDWQGPGLWNTSFGPGRAFDTRTLPANAEKQYYVDPEFAGANGAPLGIDPFSVHDGMLTITAQPASPEARAVIGDCLYTSGLINTRDTFSQLYGYFEIRAAVPGGQGLWPAFWLLPQGGGWPPELDVMEAFGSEPGVAHQAVHSKASGAHTAEYARALIEGDPHAFHTYGARWGPDQISWYLDGFEVFRAATPADMHRPMYLLANLAVGGRLPGDPDSSTPFPAQLHIDYISAYALPVSRPTGPAGPSDGADVLTGGPGFDRISALAGDDRIDGGGGDDVLDGGPGADSFVFAPGSGRDLVYHFRPGADRLDLEGYRAAGLAPTVVQGGADTVFSFATGETITLKFVDMAALTSPDPWTWG